MSWGSPDQQQMYNEIGEAFLESLGSGKNVVLESEFEKYLPLFKKSLLDEMTPEAKTRLSAEYNIKFSPYEPITVISQELDPNGVLFKGFHYSEDDVRVGDGKHHKVVAVYPARFRKLQSINAIGEEAEEIIGLMGAAAISPSGGLDPRTSEAFKRVNAAIHKANPSVVTKDDIRNNEIEAKLMGLPTQSTNQPAQTSSDSDPEEFDADWS
jgi:hypothetical protein